VFFFYNKEKHCDQRYGKSEALPPFMYDVPCNNLCESDGMFTNITVSKDKNPTYGCTTCPANSIAVRGGFIYDAKMDPSVRKIFPDKQ